MWELQSAHAQDSAMYLTAHVLPFCHAFVRHTHRSYSCIGVERGAQPLVTLITRLFVRNRIQDLDVFAGVIFTRADNEEIQTLQDLQDKVIAAGEKRVMK